MHASRPQIVEQRYQQPPWYLPLLPTSPRCGDRVRLFFMYTCAYISAEVLCVYLSIYHLAVCVYLYTPLLRGKTKGSKGARQVQLLRSRGGGKSGGQQQQWGGGGGGGGEKKDGALGMLIKCTPQEEEKRLQRMNRFGISSQSAPAAGGSSASETNQVRQSELEQTRRRSQRVPRLVREAEERLAMILNCTYTA